MIDKQQLQAMGEHQAERHMCMAKQIEDLQARLQECANGAAKMQEQRDQLAAQLKEARAEARKFKLAGLGMAVSIGEHVCTPEGWQLVPKEATMAMISAATAASTGFGTRAQWDAMLAAAPKPEQTK